MILIAHRGNTHGPKPEYENYPQYVTEALKAGYDVEIDVWFTDNKFYLGHDNPQYEVPLIFLENEKLWCHAKNLGALEIMQGLNVHYFWHQNDDITLTSKNFVWTFPNKSLIYNSICVLPELYNQEITSKATGICSDYISKYK